MGNYGSEQKIKNAVYDILKKKHVKDTSVAEICRCAKVTRPTFYSYFSDKYDATSNVQKDLIEKYVNMKGVVTFPLFITDMHKLIHEHSEFLIHSIYMYNDFNLLENPFANSLQVVLYKILSDNGWKKEQDPHFLCHMACNQFAHILTRLTYITLADYKYYDNSNAQSSTTTNNTTLLNIEMVKSLVPTVLTKYFF